MRDNNTITLDQHIAGLLTVSGAVSNYHVTKLSADPEYNYRFDVVFEVGSQVDRAVLIDTINTGVNWKTLKIETGTLSMSVWCI